MTHLSARPATRSSEWQIHCSRQGLSDESPHVLDCLKPSPTLFNTYWFARELSRPGVSREGVQVLEGMAEGHFKAKTWASEDLITILDLSHCFDFNLEQLIKPQFPRL